MKQLKDVLEASLLGDMEDVMQAAEEIVIKEEIKKFIKKNYEIAKFVKISAKPNADGKYVVNAKEVRAKNKIETLTNGMFVWGTIEGAFDCMFCDRLRSLEGCPTLVKGSLYLHSKVITSISGLTTKSLKTIDVSMHNLSSLEGANLTASSLAITSKVLKDLKGIYEWNMKTLVISFCDGLTSLEGLDTIADSLIIEHCDKLTSLKGAPEKVDKIEIRYCEALEDYTDMPCADRIIIHGKNAHKIRKELIEQFIAAGKIDNDKQIVFYR